jgi:hypothetical protein
MINTFFDIRHPPPNGFINPDNSASKSNYIGISMLHAISLVNLMESAGEGRSRSIWPGGPVGMGPYDPKKRMQPVLISGLGISRIMEKGAKRGFACQLSPGRVKPLTEEGLQGKEEPGGKGAATLRQFNTNG